VWKGFFLKRKIEGVSLPQEKKSKALRHRVQRSLPPCKKRRLPQEKERSSFFLKMKRGEEGLLLIRKRGGSLQQRCSLSVLIVLILGQVKILFF
jgi:hypothetical protein